MPFSFRTPTVFALPASSAPENASDYRRPFLLVLALTLLIAGGGLRLFSVDGAGGWQTAGSAMMFRMGIAFGALWLAWPSLRRPASWLPPGAAAATLVLLGAVAARPRLLPVLLPLAGGIATLAAIIRLLRGLSSPPR